MSDYKPSEYFKNQERREFSAEEADIIREFIDIVSRGGGVVFSVSLNQMTRYEWAKYMYSLLDNRTVKPLEFPCFLCGEELDIDKAYNTDMDYFVSCENEDCPFSCAYMNADSLDELSEELNNERN